MEEYLNISVIWFIIGLAFFLLEFIVPGFILFFFGVGAWIVAVLTLFLDIPVNIEILIFLGTSLITVAFFRRWAKDKLGMYKEADQVLEDEFIGKRALAETDILPDQQGKVEFRGTTWDASSDYPVKAGEQVTIVGNRSILLIVKPIKTI